MVRINTPLSRYSSAVMIFESLANAFVAGAKEMMYMFSSSQLAATSWGFVTFTLIYYLVSIIQAGYIPELFPMEVRMRRSCVCVVAGRIAT